MTDCYRPSKTISQTVGATSLTFAAFSANVSMVRLQTTGDCWVNLNAAASVGNLILLRAADPPEFIAVNDRDVLRVIQNGASTGTLYVTEMTS